MPLDFAVVRRKLKDFQFESLFIEDLGWDHHRAEPLEITVDGGTFKLKAVAQKRGMVAFLCDSAGPDGMPDYPVRRKIERQVTRAAHEHIVIFLDSARSLQVWQWVKRSAGKPAACREHILYASQPGDSLIQKLEAVRFSLAEED